MSEEADQILSDYGLFELGFSGRDVERYLRDVHPDVEWIPIGSALDGKVYRGHEGVRQWLLDLRDEWEIFEPIAEEVRELGDGRFLVLGHWRARGRGSGVELENQQCAWLQERRNGKLVRLQTFTDRSEALKAAGLD